MQKFTEEIPSGDLGKYLEGVWEEIPEEAPEEISPTITRKNLQRIPFKNSWRNLRKIPERIPAEITGVGPGVPEKICRDNFQGTHKKF